MPAKSKHGRGKRSQHRKKAKYRNIPAGAGPTPEAPGTMPIDASPSTPTPAARAPLPKKSATVALPMHYRFIGGDLKRIGTISGIVVVLLIIAYFVLS